MKTGVIIPYGQFNGPKSVGQLPVGCQCSFRISGSRADQGKLQIVGQKANRIQQDPLLAIASPNKACSSSMINIRVSTNAIKSRAVRRI